MTKRLSELSAALFLSDERCLELASQLYIWTIEAANFYNLLSFCLLSFWTTTPPFPWIKIIFQLMTFFITFYSYFFNPRSGLRIFAVDWGEQVAATTLHRRYLHIICLFCIYSYIHHLKKVFTRTLFYPFHKSKLWEGNGWVLFFRYSWNKIVRFWTKNLTLGITY